MLDLQVQCPLKGVGVSDGKHRNAAIRQQLEHCGDAWMPEWGCGGQGAQLQELFRGAEGAHSSFFAQYSFSQALSFMRSLEAVVSSTTNCVGVTTFILQHPCCTLSARRHPCLEKIFFQCC